MVISVFVIRDTFYDGSIPSAVRLTKVQATPVIMMAIDVEGKANGAHEGAARAVGEEGGRGGP